MKKLNSVGRLDQGVGLRGRDHKFSKIRVYQSATLRTTYQCTPATFLEAASENRVLPLGNVFQTPHDYFRAESLMSNPEGDK